KTCCAVAGVPRSNWVSRKRISQPSGSMNVRATVWWRTHRKSIAIPPQTASWSACQRTNGFSARPWHEEVTTDHNPDASCRAPACLPKEFGTPFAFLWSAREKAPSFAEYRRRCVRRNGKSTRHGYTQQPRERGLIMRRIWCLLALLVSTPLL